MRLGDILEVIAGGAFVAAAYLQWGAVAALVVAGVCLTYFGQCAAHTPFPLPKAPKFKLPRSRKRSS